MSKHHPVVLPAEERTLLESFVRSGEASAREITRARILLLCDTSQGTHRRDWDVADALGVVPETVARIRKRYAAEGLEATLTDRPRPGRPPKITGDVEARLCMLACSKPPEGHSRWTLRLLARQIVLEGYLPNLSNVAVYKRLKKTGLNLGE